jgi:hypothetical protein
MIQWEYSAPYLCSGADLGLDAVMEELKKLGADGWELVQINAQCSDGGTRVFLKRMIRPPDPPILVPEGWDARPGAMNLVG